jgi:phosphatidylglycerophosphatase A
MASASRDLVGRVLRDPVHWIPFGFGAGLLPMAPGSWGSLVAVLAFWLAPPLPVSAHLMGVLAGFVLGVWLCGASARRLGAHDHPGIVFDEIVAMWAILAVLPRQLMWSIAAFLLFRFLDIWKPWPIREADHRMGGGLGIMLDDALAAAFAAAILLSAKKVAALLT